MIRSLIRLFGFDREALPRAAADGRFRPQLESLGGRVAPAVTIATPELFLADVGLHGGSIDPGGYDIIPVQAARQRGGEEIPTRHIGEEIPTRHIGEEIPQGRHGEEIPS